MKLNFEIAIGTANKILSEPLSNIKHLGMTISTPESYPQVLYTYRFKGVFNVNPKVKSIRDRDKIKLRFHRNILIGTANKINILSEHFNRNILIFLPIYHPYPRVYPYTYRLGARH